MGGGGLFDDDGVLGAVALGGAGLLFEIGPDLGRDHDATPHVVALEHTGRQGIATTVAGAGVVVDRDAHRFAGYPVTDC